MTWMTLSLKLKYVNLPAYLFYFQQRHNKLNTYNGLYQSRHFCLFSLLTIIASLFYWEVESLKNDYQNILAFSMSPIWRQHELKLAWTPQVYINPDDSCHSSMIWQHCTKWLVMSQSAWLSKSPHTWSIEVRQSW